MIDVVLCIGGYCGWGVLLGVGGCCRWGSRTQPRPTPDADQQRPYYGTGIVYNWSICV